MTLTTRARIEILVLTVLALGSCDDMSRTYKPSQIEDIAKNAATYAIQSSDRIAMLESRIEEIEYRLNRLD